MIAQVPVHSLLVASNTLSTPNVLLSSGLPAMNLIRTNGFVYDVPVLVTINRELSEAGTLAMTDCRIWFQHHSRSLKRVHTITPSGQS